MLEEMGQPYELVEKSAHPDDLQTAEYLRLNPNARIPTLVDGDLVVWESLAINLYHLLQHPQACRLGAVAVLARTIRSRSNGVYAYQWLIHIRRLVYHTKRTHESSNNGQAQTDELKSGARRSRSAAYS